MRAFVAPGDSILSASTDNLALSIYAAGHVDGTLSLLVINKDLNHTLGAQITFDAFIPQSEATIQSYGVPQDDAARDQGPAEAQDIATVDFKGAAASFGFDFPPLSITLMTLVPSVAP
jgi:hypothetical protein